MNRNFYAVAMATVMTAICFAGCSNAPVEESDTGTESSAIESSIFAESSVTEAESSVVTVKQLHYRPLFHLLHLFLPQISAPASPFAVRLP